MPIRMVEDENQNSNDNNPGGGGGRGGGGGGGIGGGIIGMLLPLLFRNPKLFIPLLLIGGAVYYFMGSGGGGPVANAASSFVTGGVLDEKQFDKAEVFEPLADNSKNPLPERVSLEQYCPERMNQGSQGSCVAWSSAYAARTILEARKTGQNPNQVAFSPSFLYNQIKLDENCQGSYIIRATENMTQRGGLPFNEFPYNENSCDKSPNSTEMQEALQYKMRGANRLTKNGDDYEIDMLAMKQNLAQGAPVIIGMMVGGSFMQEMMGKKVWIPTRDDYSMSGFGGHAMCVIGYDDFLEGGAFQIMNSWGKEWGENGLAWVRYSDFKAFCKEAYGTYPMGSSAAPQPTTLSISVGLIDNQTKKNIPLVLKGDNLFATQSPIKVGDKFKAEVTNNRECYTYIFGQETDGSSYVLFPYTPKHSPYCGITGTRVFPKDFSMQADNKGNKDLIAIVVTNEPIDYKGMNESINKKAGNYQQKVNAALGDVAAVSFKASTNVSFEKPAADTKPVAVIVEIDKK
jgi:hypothetical protein